MCCTVHNRGDALLQGVLELTAGDGLSLHGSAEQAIEVSACSSAQRRWVIEAVACGRHAVCFTLQGRDAEELVLDVIPPGSPVRTQVEVMPGRPLVVPSEADDHQVCASLHVALPSLAPFAQLVAWSRYRHGCSEQTASRVETAARVLGYADRHGLRLAGREATETMIDQGVGTLLAWQGPKGWSWYGEGEDPYLSSLVLRGLVAARQVGRDVPESAIRQGLVGLFRTRSSWHEADGFGYGLPEELLLAEVLGALQAVQSVLPNRRVEDAVDELMEQLTRQMMEDPPSDPYLLSIAVQPVAEAHPEMVQLAAGMVLTDWRAEGHPRFAGPGGQDEALAAASRVLRISGLAVPPEWARQLSRPSPDDLFNTRGLAMRTRALVELEPDSTFEGRLTIRVGNQCVRETQLDRDSHTSAALDLAWVDLSGHLVPGVEVSVDLEPAELEGLQVHLECARWPASGAAMEQLSRHLSHQTATVGQGVEVTLELDGELPDWSVLREPLPSNTRVDRESLDALVAAGQICSWSQVAGALQLYFESPPSRLTYGLIADRVGVCSQPGPLLAPMYGSASATLQGAATCLRVT